MKYSKRDIELARAVPIEEVLRLEGYQINKGFLKCPSPEHNEKTASCHIHKRYNNCKCFGCGRTFNTVDIIQIAEGLSFQDAIKRLSEIGGFQTEGVEKEEIPYILPTKKEMELVGIKTGPVYATVNVSDTKPDSMHMPGNDGEYVILKNADYNPFAELAKDPEVMYMLIRGKAYEKYTRISRIIEEIRNDERYEYLLDIMSADKEEIINELLSLQKELKAIIKRFKGKPRAAA